jgi:hypothetical protein
MIIYLMIRSFKEDLKFSQRRVKIRKYNQIISQLMVKILHSKTKTLHLKEVKAYP